MQPSLLVFVEVEAGTEAPDGMRLRHWIPFNATSLDQLPPAQAISDSIRRMAADLTALRAAPVLEADYSGPVLFTGQASAEMFARVLAPNLSGQRLPLTDREQQGSGTRSELADRMNRPVLPAFLSVVDDPTEQRVETPAVRPGVLGDGRSPGLGFQFSPDPSSHFSSGAFGPCLACRPMPVRRQAKEDAHNGKGQDRRDRSDEQQVLPHRSDDGAHESNAEEDADDADHDHQLHQREAAGLQRRSATRERSQIGRNTPRARIRTITPRNTIRMGSIWAASVLMS